MKIKIDEGFSFTDIDYMTVKEIDKEIGWPMDYVSTLHLVTYISRLKGDVTGVEIGTCRGEGAYLILEKCPNVKKIYTIDPYVEYMDWIGVIKQEILDKQEEIAKKNFEEFGDRVEMIRSTSEEAVVRFEDNSLDFVFIDGDHSEQHVYNDMMKYYPKLKKGGIFAGNGYVFESVKVGIKKFQNETKVRTPIQKGGQSTWFFYK